MSCAEKMEHVFIHLCGAMQLLLLSMEEIKMAKAATAKSKKKSETKFLKIHDAFTSKELKSSKLVAEALLECIKSGDLESFREVLTVHLMTVNKVEVAKKAGIGRRTLYDLIDPKKEFNPELSTVAAVIRALTV